MRKRTHKPKRLGRERSLTKYVVFSLAMVILMTIACLILTAKTSYDYSQIYTVFCGVFGGEILCSCILKLMKIKEGEET